MREGGGHTEEREGLCGSRFCRGRARDLMRMRPWRLLIALIGSALACAGLSSGRMAAMADTLKAGAARSNITPPLGTLLAGSFSARKSVDVHDELHAKALVLDNGETRIAIVVCDLIAAPRKYLDKSKELIQERCGIPPENVLISCTHTHTGPSSCGLLGTPGEPEYMEWATVKIADSVQLALNRLQPARLGYGVGREPGQVFNRRFRMKDGTVRMNPGRLNPDIVEPVGPTDPDVGVLVVESADGEPICLLANYALHYVGGGRGTSISADYFAFFGDAVRKMTGKDFVVMMSNGFCGDINNVDVSSETPKGPPYSQAHQVARILAAEAVKVWKEMQFADEVDLEAALSELTITRRPITPEQVAEAKEKLKTLPEKDVRGRVYANEIIYLSEWPEEEQTWVQVLAVNDLALVGCPGEMFVELGLEIKRRSPAGTTFTIELANDYAGYIPTVKAFDEGGYETWFARSSRMVPETGPQMVEEACRLLQRLVGSGQ